MRNARFWIMGPGSSPVKLTLKHGQRIQWGHAWHNGEGWSSEHMTLEYLEGMVYREDGTDGTDCDGRLSTFTETVCELENLAANNGGFEDDPPFPAWERVQANQRDYTAEAMGY